MHTSSLVNMKRFAEKYMKAEEKYKILDIGSQEVDGDSNGSYRHIFQNPNWEYVGADVVKGKNVDIVLQEAYRWKNIKSKTFDCVVCGQMLEHDEFFWLTMMEIKRIIKPGGICCIIAPSGGPEHRYPVDCYRYYPDGLRAVARYAGLEVLETYAQWNESIYPEMDSDWRDCVLICKRPEEGLVDELKFVVRHWMLFVSSRNVADVDYSNDYSQETTWTTPLPSVFSSLYFDIGGGFSEEQVERHRVKTFERYKQHYDLPKNCKGIRFDPVEGCRCMVRNLKVITKNEVLVREKFQSNGTMISNEMYLFTDTTDPQIYIEVPTDMEWVEIEADISIIS